MSALAEEARALLLAVAELPPQRLRAFVTAVRDAIPLVVFQRLSGPTTSALIDAKRTLATIVGLVAAQDRAGEQALGVWIACARASLDARRSLRADELGAALRAPGRDARIDAFIPERTKFGTRDDLVGIEWLARGQRAAEAVAYLEVTKFLGLEERETEAGTAFLIDRQHVMTAFHVIEQRAVAEGPASKDDLAQQVASARIAFDYLAASVPGRPRGTPEPIAELVAFDRELDYAVLRLAQPRDSEPVRFSVASLPPIDEGLGFVANIIQHPLRRPKQLGLRNNAVWRVDERSIFYFTDTRGGTSGAPVFNDAWCVIAMHTGWEEFTNEQPIYMGRNIGFANQGTRSTRIVKDLRDRKASAPTLSLGLTVVGQ